MTYFSSLGSTFINTTQNPSQKYKDINKTVLNLYNNLLSGELALPILDFEYTELLDTIDLTYVTAFETLNESAFIDGKLMRVGYSPLKIAESISGDPRNILGSIDNYQNKVVELSEIYIRLNKSFYHHKALEYLFGDLNYKFGHGTNLTKFRYLNDSFKYTFKKEDYNDSNLDKENLAVIPFILTYYLLFKLHTISFRFPQNILSTVYKNSDNFIDDEYINQFVSYFDIEKELISTSLSDYIMNNVFLFGTQVAPEVKEQLQTTISDNLYKFKEIFLSNKQEIMTSDFIFTLSFELAFHVLSYNCLVKLHGPDSLYKKLTEFLHLSESDIDIFKMEEDVVLSKIQEYVKFNISDLNDLHLVSTQFVEEPLFFLNAYIAGFSQLVVDYMQNQDIDYEAVPLTKVKKWLRSFFNLKSNGKQFLYDYMNSSPLIYPNSSPDYLKLPFFLLTREIIIKLFNHSEMKNYLMKEFIPILTKNINKKYYLQIDWYKHADQILSFLKTLLMKHLLENKLLTQYIKNYDDLIKTSIPTTSFVLTPDMIDSLFNSESVLNETLFHSIFNSFFKGSAISKYLENFLNRAYSL